MTAGGTHGDEGDRPLDRSTEEADDAGSPDGRRWVGRVARDVLARVRGEGMAAESVWGIGYQLAGILTSVASFTLLGRTLGTTGYGDYAALYAVAGPLITLSSSGVILALLQHNLRYGEPLAATARSCLSLAIGIGIGTTVLGTVVTTHVVHSLSMVAIVSLLFVEFVLAPVTSVVATTVQAARSYVGTAQIGMVVTAGRLAVIVVLAATGSLTVANLGVGTLIVTGVLNVILLRTIGRRYGFTFLPGRIRMAHLKSNINFSVAISASALNNEADKFMLSATDQHVDAGLYAAASRFASFPMIPISVLVDVSHKTFLRHDPRQMLSMAKRFGLLAVVYGVAVIGVTYVAAPYVVPLVLGDEFEGSITIVRWLSPLVLLRGLSTFGLNALMGLDRVTERTILVVVTAVVGVVLYLVLVPTHGWRGAVAGTLISELFEVLLIWAALVHWQRRASATAPPDG